MLLKYLSSFAAFNQIAPSVTRYLYWIYQSSDEASILHLQKLATDHKIPEGILEVYDAWLKDGGKNGEKLIVSEGYILLTLSSSIAPCLASDLPNSCKEELSKFLKGNPHAPGTSVSSWAKHHKLDPLICKEYAKFVQEKLGYKTISPIL
jgi:hypothetical protein